MKPKPDHFSLSDCRRILTEHEHPLLTLTKGEYAALVSRLEKAREMLAAYADEEAKIHAHAINTHSARLFEFRERAVREWLASLEAGK